MTPLKTFLLRLSQGDEEALSDVASAVSSGAVEINASGDLVPKLPRSAAIGVLLRSVVTEVERVAIPFASRDVVSDAPVYQEHHRAIGALAVLVGQLAIELGQPELHDRTMAAIGLPVKA